MVLFSASRRDGKGLRHAVNKLIDAKTGRNAVDMLDIMIQVATGTLVGRARAPNPGEDPSTYATLVPLVHPSIQQRFEAAKTIYEQRNGKPRTGSDTGAQLNLSENGASLSIPANLENYTDQELEILQMLLAKNPRTITVNPDEDDAEIE